MLPLFYRHKTGAAALLSALLAFQACGWMVVWSVSRQQARQYAQRDLFRQPKEQQVVTLSMDDWRHWRTEDGELWLHGRLFDSRLLVLQSDSIQLALLPDEKEEHLIGILETVLTSSMRSGRNLPDSGTPLVSQLLQWLDAAYLPGKPPVLVFLLSGYRGPGFWYICAFKAPERRRPDPPPERFHSAIHPASAA